MEEKKDSGIKKEYISFLRKNKIPCYPKSNTLKPYLNSISPGCISCLKGTWGCVYINSLCTRRCFYCTQDRDKVKERPIVIDKIYFSSIKPAFDYLNKHNFSGIGFSGGEPFLSISRVIGLLENLRKNNLKKYIWIYTNGDNLKMEYLMVLGRLGLDEIRFDISARDYDLSPLLLAKQFINTISIEIPAIPYDIDIVKNQLKEYEKLGVKYLNLHQLLATRLNYKELLNRGYTLWQKDIFLSGKNNITTVLESEETALEILRYAKNIKSKLGINYCSSDYKNYFQVPAIRKRYIQLTNKKAQTTKLGLVREIKKIKNGLLINYYSNKVMSKKRVSKINDIKFFEKLEKSISLENEISVLFFRKLFLENWDPEKLGEFMRQKYVIGKKKVIEDIKIFLKDFSDVEGSKETF